MPKISNEPLENINLKLFKSDLDFVRELYGAQLGTSKALRNIIRAYVKNVRARAAAKIDSQEAKANVSAEPQLSASP